MDPHASPLHAATSSGEALIDRALQVVLADGAEATRLAVQALAKAGADGQVAALAHATLGLIECREGELPQAVHHLQAAQALLAGCPAPTRAHDLVQHLLAHWHRREQRLVEAEAVLVALHARADSRPPLDAYLTAGALGIVTSMRGDNDQSLDLLYQALHLARRCGEDAVLANALNNLGSFEADLYNLDDARPMLEEALAGARRLGSQRMRIYAAGNLVQCLCLMGEAAQALRVVRDELQPLMHETLSPNLRRDDEIALALLENGLVDEAAGWLAREQQADPLSNEVATLRVCLEARVLIARGAPAEALQRCMARREVILAPGDEITTAIDHVSLLRVAARAAEAMADHAAAYRLLSEAFALHERLLGRAARARQRSLQITHRLRQTEWDRDIARKLAQQALEDPLTGLHNRRHLFDAGKRMLAMMSRRGEPLTAALVDLDHFKQINDRHGHDAGDGVLRGFADLLRRHTRAEDLVCRYGGEEFVILLPGADLAQAVRRLEDLLARFAQIRFAAANDDFACTFSAGLASCGDQRPPLETLLRRADEALYAAKAAGRARVTGLQA